jgi:hypothetical protein
MEDDELILYYNQFFIDQIVFLDNMPAEYKEILYRYTFHGYLLMNSINQNENRDKLILDEIFLKIPPVKEDFIVYRGTKKEPYFDNRIYTSTSLSIKIAKDPDFTEKDCCLLKITVKAGTKVIPLLHFTEFPEELEVLLDRKGYLVQFEKSYIDPEVGKKTFEMIYF